MAEADFICWREAGVSATLPVEVFGSGPKITASGTLKRGQMLAAVFNHRLLRWFSAPSFSSGRPLALRPISGCGTTITAAADHGRMAVEHV